MQSNVVDNTPKTYHKVDLRLPVSRRLSGSLTHVSSSCIDAIPDVLVNAVTTDHCFNHKSRHRFADSCDG